MSAVRRAVVGVRQARRVRRVRRVRPVRYEWLGVRIGGPDASMKGQWWVLFLAAAVVFACFFAIGRLGAGGTLHGEPSSALRAPSGRAAIPGGLRGDSPIAGSVPSAIAPKPARSTPAPAASASSEASTTTQPLAEDASRASAPSSPAVAPVVVQPVPVKAVAPVTANSQHGGSAGRRSSGGSFDTSE